MEGSLLKFQSRQDDQMFCFWTSTDKSNGHFFLFFFFPFFILSEKKRIRPKKESRVCVAKANAWVVYVGCLSSFKRISDEIDVQRKEPM
jgi:hypothetical protein